MLVINGKCNFRQLLPFPISLPFARVLKKLLFKSLPWKMSSQKSSMLFRVFFYLHPQASPGYGNGCYSLWNPLQDLARIAKQLHHKKCEHKCIQIRFGKSWFKIYIYLDNSWHVIILLGTNKKSSPKACLKMMLPFPKVKGYFYFPWGIHTNPSMFTLGLPPTQDSSHIFWRFRLGFPY